MTVRLMTVRVTAVALATVATSFAVAGKGPQTEFFGPIPYLSAADSPFNILEEGCFYALEDFESGAISIPGMNISPGAVKPPGPTTDSVDADDGVIDGWGNNGHSWQVPANQIVLITFDPVALGGYPTEAGLVWTDGFPNGGVTFLATDAVGNLVGSTINQLGDAFNNGSTAEDRFLGLKHAGGISSISVIGILDPIEIDHVQFRLPTAPPPVQFVGPLPYKSGADSPFGISLPSLTAVLDDFEDGIADSPGLTMNHTSIVGPNGLAASVDGDTGEIDGLGKKARSALKANTSPLVFEFDAAVLGGLPTQFGAVITQLNPGPHQVTVRVYGSINCLLAEEVYEIIGDGSPNGATDSHRFLGATHAGGIRRVEFDVPTSPIQFDHVQYDLPVPRQTAFIGPRAYLSADYSPFNLNGVGFDFALEDFESGAVQVPGMTVNITSVAGPGGNTDSVDADDGVIDGSGTLGRCGFTLQNPLVINWDAAVLGGLPTQIGLVVTDQSGGSIPFTARLFDANLNQIGAEKVYFLVGDFVVNGTTDEDSFIGMVSEVPIRRLTLQRPGGGIDLDHIQYNLPVPLPDPFLGPTPYLSIDDSPLLPLVDEETVVWYEDFEAASFNLPGTTINLDMIKLPGPTTDSVDEDTGAIDGSGTNGHSAIKMQGAPLVIVFDEAVLGMLPPAVGLAWTDCGAGVANVTLEAYGPGGTLISKKKFYSLGDNVDTGATAEDRFLGIVHEPGIKELRVLSNRMLEFDHVQFVGPKPEKKEEPLVGDLNDDGIVDGADLGIMLFSWGPCAGCPADLNDDGVIDGADLGILLSNWTVS